MSIVSPFAAAGPLVTLAGVLLGVGVACAVAAVIGMARRLGRPPRMDDAKALRVLDRLTPDDLGLAYEPVAFDVEDAAAPPARLEIAAWWLPCPSPAADRCCVLLHGYGDAKVGGVAWAPVLLSLGWNVLALDLRAHGESGGSHTTAGYYERHDVGRVIDRLRSERPGRTRHVAVFGVSLGAAVAAAVAADRDDLCAVVLECPYADYRSAVAAWASRGRTPLPSLWPTAVRLAERWSAADYDAVRPVETLRRARCPALAIHGGADPFVSAADVAAVAAALPPGSEHWVVPGAAHVRSMHADPAAYRARVGAFLDRASRHPAHGVAPVSRS